MLYYIAKSAKVTLPVSKRPFKLNKGVHHIPDELANHLDANKYGIKPVEEMTDAEYRAAGMKRPTKATT